MSQRRSVKGFARRAMTADTRERAKAVKVGAWVGGNLTADSFVNFAQKMGVGADNALSSASYGFNPITRIRTMLEWIHRGSWLGGVAIDLVADDMTRAGIEIESEMQPEDLEKLAQEAVRLRLWRSIASTIKWARLYGGSLGVMLIDGQRPETPLNLETVGKGQFKGLLVLDRWAVEPSMQDVITSLGPDMGLPKFYTIVGDSPAYPRTKIHHSRCLRFEGIELPYWQRVIEQMWGISVIERLYDRMVAFDSATTGAAQLVYKSFIRTYSIEGMREVIGSGGPALEGLVRYTEMMRRFQNMEGITLLDGKDKMETHAQAPFSGLSEVLLQFGQQLAGALQIPLVRLFGQSPAGLNSTGESDLRMYYDGINQQQEQQLRIPITLIYQAMARSLGIEWPEGSRIIFKSLWQLTDEQKADIANTTVDAVTKAEEAGLISQQTAMKELQTSSHVTGIFTNIQDSDIENAEESLPPAGEEAAQLGLSSSGAGPGENPQPGEQGLEDPTPEELEARVKKAQSKDSISAVSNMKQRYNIDVIIENPRGSVRRGKDWSAVMPYDYGYIRQTTAPDNDPLDCMVGPDYASRDVYVIDQVKLATRQPDEPKVMFAYKDYGSAIKDFLMGYSDGRGWERIGGIRSMSIDEFVNSYLPQWRTPS
jgi:uncharacterized protein